MSGLDLYLSQRVLAMMLVYAALAGFCLGGVRDLLGLLTALLLPLKAEKETCGGEKGFHFSTKAFLTFWQDLLFLLLVAVTFILLCYYTNDGQIRAPAISGMAGGFFVYCHTVGLLTKHWILRLAAGIKHGLIRTVILIFYPIRFLMTVLYALGKILWQVTGGKLVALSREKNTQKRIKSMTEAASRGFDTLGEKPSSAKEKFDSAA